jgi:hypothetical protein
MINPEPIQCGYPGCKNPAERRLITNITGVGNVDLSLDMCEAHYELRDIDDDVIDWMREELQKHI